MNAPIPIPIPALAAEVAAQLSGTALLGVTMDAGTVRPNGIAGAAAGSLAAWRAEHVSVTQFGARGDASVGGDGVLTAPGTDDTAAFALGFAWLAGATGRVLEIPAGTYNLASLSSPLVIPDGAGVIGASMNNTRILWNDAAGFNLFVTAGTSSQPVHNITLQDFTVVGSCATNWVASNGGYPFLLNNAQGVILRNISAQWSRAMGIVLRNCAGVAIENPVVRYTAMDGISVTACEDVLISNAVVEWTDDDAISWHADITEFSPHGHFCLNGFRIRQTGGGINALGAKICVINGGTLELVRFQGISVGGANGSEGNTSLYGVSISNVVIRDMLDASLAGSGASGCRALCINNAPLRNANLPAPPGLNNPASATVVPLIGNVDGNSLTAPIGIGSGVTITNLQVFVGRKPAQYSTFGVGQMFTRHGWLDPVVTQAGLQPTALDCLSGVIRDIKLHNCLFEGGGAPQAIFLGEGVRLLACEISACTFRDFTQSVLSGNGIVQDLSLRGGLADLDPYLRASSRAASAGIMDGSWTANSGGPVFAQNVQGVRITGMAFRNLYAIFAGAFIPQLKDCILFADPAAVGYSAANKGIGVIPAAGSALSLVQENCNPADDAFGEILFEPKLDMASQPNSGTWLANTFVRNNAVSVDAGKILLGWMRITTGSTHVSGVDWVPVYGATQI